MVLSQLSDVTLGIIYSFYYDPETKSFISMNSEQEDGVRPTFNDVAYAEQQFIKLRNGWLTKLGTDKISMENFTEMIQALFEKNMKVIPIINYLQHKGLIAYGSGIVKILN